MGVLCGSAVGDSRSPGLFLPEPGAELLRKWAMQQGLSDLFWAGAFSSRVGWAWSAC